MLWRPSLSALAIGGLALALAAPAQGQAVPRVAKSARGSFVMMDDPLGGCRQAWINIDTNGDGLVAGREARATLDAEFAIFDRDNNGTITRGEWTNCAGDTMYAGAPPPAREGLPKVASFTEVEAEFEAGDADRDGKLSRDEAIEVARAIFAKAAPGTNEVDMARAYGRRFLVIDVNDDGAISGEEWAGRGRATLDGRFARYDANKDGSISLAEWRNVVKVIVPKATPTDEDAIDVWELYFRF